MFYLILHLSKKVKLISWKLIWDRLSTIKILKVKNLVQGIKIHRILIKMVLIIQFLQKDLLDLKMLLNKLIRINSF